jgi:hypothetical protein
MRSRTAASAGSGSRQPAGNAALELTWIKKTDLGVDVSENAYILMHQVKSFTKR